eukprot:298915-Chlamydomonas_euryale.AAC.1
MLRWGHPSKHTTELTPTNILDEAVLHVDVRVDGVHVECRCLGFPPEILDCCGSGMSLLGFPARDPGLL